MVQAGHETPPHWTLWTGAAGARVTRRAGFRRDPPVRALSLHFLGEVIDVHAGGIEMCAPHHEHERAVSDTAAGHAVVRHWVHAGRLRFEGAAGRSAGHACLDDLTGRGLDPLALRLALLEHHYREPLDLGRDAWPTPTARCADGGGSSRSGRPPPASHARVKIARSSRPAFDADLDTPAAWACCARLRRMARFRRARSSSRSRTPTSCSGWIWPARSAGLSGLAGLPGGRSGRSHRRGAQQSSI